MKDQIRGSSVLLHRKASTSGSQDSDHCCPNTCSAIPISRFCLSSCPYLLMQITLRSNQLPNNMYVGRGVGFSPSSLLAGYLPWRQDIARLNHLVHPSLLSTGVGAPSNLGQLSQFHLLRAPVCWLHAVRAHLILWPHIPSSRSQHLWDMLHPKYISFLCLCLQSWYYSEIITTFVFCF